MNLNLGHRTSNRNNQHLYSATVKQIYNLLMWSVASTIYACSFATTFLPYSITGRYNIRKKNILAQFFG